MRQIPCRGGRVIEVLDEDHWVVPHRSLHIEGKQRIDFTVLPGEVREWWRTLLESACQSMVTDNLLLLWSAIRFLTRFLSEYGILTTS